jgi:ceramide glucosyltransferase
MNTEFWSGVLVAQMLAPMDFAVGPTMAVRRECLEALGGFEAVREYLAEDFVLGRMAREQGYEVLLTRHAVEHRIGSQGLAENLRHRIRWQRSTRRSRPVGYAGEVFTNPLPLAAALVAVAGGAAWAWGIFAACAAMRAAAAAAVARGVLGARLNFEFWALLPLQDAASLAVWLLGFFGRTIVWRGRRFELLPDGRLRPR